MAGALTNIPETAVIPRTCRERFLPLREAFARPLRARGVEMSGLSELVPPYEIGRPDPQFHVVLCTRAGAGRFETAEASGSFRPGVAWVGRAHAPQHYQSGRRWSMAWFHLEDSDRWSALRRRAPEVRPAPWLAESSDSALPLPRMT